MRVHKFKALVLWCTEAKKALARSLTELTQRGENSRGRKNHVGGRGGDGMSLERRADVGDSPLQRLDALGVNSI